MIVYNIDSNGNYLGEHICQPCPMSGDYLYPAYYTETPPPEINEFKKAVFNFDLKEWVIQDCFIDKTLYHKETKEQIKITEEGKTPADYPDYTDVEIPEPMYAVYYDYSESGWVFNLTRYKADACNKVTALCVNANYVMFPQYKRDNIYSGSPVTDNYPGYLKGDAGKASIAKLNAVYQEISIIAQTNINSEAVQNREAVDEIIDAITFPTEAEILNQIQS